VTLILTACMAIGGDQGCTMVSLEVSLVACIIASFWGNSRDRGFPRPSRAVQRAVVMVQACEVLVLSWWANNASIWCRRHPPRSEVRAGRRDYQCDRGWKIGQPPAVRHAPQGLYIITESKVPRPVRLERQSAVVVG
jgi:hypothetical protein